MKNRYITIKPSDMHFDSNGNNYPDIFSFPINSFVSTISPQKYVLSERDIYRFDLLMFHMYKDSNYDDLILFLNNIEHISDVAPGTEILLYAKEDLDNFYKNFKT